MRNTESGSKWADTGVSRGLCWKSGTAVLQQLGAAVIVAQACGQPAYLSSPKELLETDPRSFAQWLQTNRPKPVSARDRTGLLTRLPSEGQVTNLDAASLRKLATLKPLLRAIGRETAYEIKVIDTPLARTGLYERTLVLITQAALTRLEAEELQAQVAHEFGHEYVWVDYDRASARKDHGRLKNLELLCDAIAIATLHGLGVDPSRLMAGLERLTRYNEQAFGTAVDERNYPTLSERREFARAVTAWMTRGSSPRSSRRLTSDPSASARATSSGTPRLPPELRYSSGPRGVRRGSHETHRHPDGRR